jgi:hypothetical protein
LVTAVIEQIVEAEGPVHTRRLAKLACAAFDLRKVSEQRTQAVLRLIDRQMYILDADSFVWPAALRPSTWDGYRRNGPETDRKIEHVSKVELGNAMVDICRSAAGVSLDDLKRLVVRKFGGSRVTVGIGERLEAAARDAIADGKLTMDEFGTLRAVP